MEAPTVTPVAPESAPLTTVPASEAAIATGDITSYREARRAERSGKPLDAVTVKAPKDGPVEVAEVSPDDRRAAVLAKERAKQPLTPDEKKILRAAKQEDINEGARKAAGRVVEDYEARIKALEAQIQATQTAPPPNPEIVKTPPPERVQPQITAGDPADPEPNAGDLAKYPGGEYDPKYLRDVNAWDTRQILAKRDAISRATDEQRARQQAHVQTAKTFSGRIEAAAATDPAFAPPNLDWPLPNPQPGGPKTFLESLKPTAELPPGTTAKADNIIADFILRSEVAPQLLREFKANPASYYRILRDGITEFFRLEGRLQAATPTSSAAPAPVTPPPQYITSAPAPPATLGSHTTTTADPIAAAVNTGKGSLSGGVREFRAARLQERRAAQGR